MNITKRTIGAAIVAFGIALGVTAPASAADIYLTPGQTLSPDTERYLMVGDRVIVHDPSTGEIISERTITTSPSERYEAEYSQFAAAKIAAGAQVGQSITYTKTSRKRDKGVIVLPTMELLGCVNTPDGEKYTWRTSGGTYRSIPLMYGNVRFGDGAKRVNYAATFTTDSPDFAMTYAKTKAKYKRGHFKMRERWTVTYVAQPGTFVCS